MINNDQICSDMIDDLKLQRRFSDCIYRN